MLKATSDTFQGIDGLKEKIEYKDDKAIEALEKESAKMLESQGYKEVSK